MHQIFHKVKAHQNQEPTETQATKETDPQISPLGIIRYRRQNSSIFFGSSIFQQLFIGHLLDAQSSSRPHKFSDKFIYGKINNPMFLKELRF